MKKTYTPSGLATLIVVIIVGSAALIMSLSAILLSIGEAELSYIDAQEGETLSLADACMEESYRQLRLNPNYSGETLSLGDGTCIIEVIQEDDYRTSTVTSTIGNYHKKIQSALQISASTTFTILSWNELTN